MKTLKSLFLLCAGLSFCACSSDNEPQFPEGEGMVEVRVVAPETRTLADSETSSVTINGDITITLYATFVNANGVSEVTTKTATISRNELNEGVGSAKFWNVKAPTLVTASVNGGENDYTETSITTFANILPANIHAYGQVQPTPTTNTASPTLGNDIDNNVNANTGDNTKKYQVYTANIQMEIPVARLEISGISLSNESNYSALNLVGVYLDNIREYGSLWGTGFGDYGQVAAADYAYADGIGTGAVALLKDEVGTDIAAGDANPQVPTSPRVYAYNFYGAPANTEYSVENAAKYNPSFKLYFDTGTTTETVSFPRFALITSYSDAQANPLVLKNGHIYRIDATDLQDVNIIGDESGNTLYTVSVTVTEAEWNIIPTTGNWAQ